MKIRPVILCGGAGTRLWPQSKKNVPKQFIDFGGWNLFKKALERISDPVFDNPIISTNLKYLKHIKKNLINSELVDLKFNKTNEEYICFVKKNSDNCLFFKCEKNEYGPIEDIHLIINHIFAHWFQKKL